MVTPRPAWFDRACPELVEGLTTNGRFGGMRGVIRLAVLAAGLVLALTVMPGCGSGCPTPEERTYLEAMVDWSEKSVAGSEEMFPILQEGGRRSGALIDEDWRRRLKRVLDELTSAQEAIINVEVPSSRAEESHRAVVRVAEAVIEGNELLWQGVLDVDAETLQRGLDKYEESNLLIEEATETGERFCE